MPFDAKTYKTQPKADLRRDHSHKPIYVETTVKSRFMSRPQPKADLCRDHSQKPIYDETTAKTQDLQTTKPFDVKIYVPATAIKPKMATKIHRSFMLKFGQQLKAKSAGITQYVYWHMCPESLATEACDCVLSFRPKGLSTDTSTSDCGLRSTYITVVTASYFKRKMLVWVLIFSG